VAAFHTTMEGIVVLGSMAVAGMVQRLKVMAGVAVMGRQVGYVWAQQPEAVCVVAWHGIQVFIARTVKVTETALVR